MISDEILRMMQMTKPKLIFCQAYNIGTVREVLKQLQISVPIFTFDMATSQEPSRLTNYLLTLDRITIALCKDKTCRKRLHLFKAIIL